MTGRRLLAGLATLLLAVTACSGTQAPPKPPVPESTAQAIALLDHVQEDPIQPGAIVVDVARLRTLLNGGTTDLDAAVRSKDQAAKHFAELVQVGLPQLQTWDEWPAGKALDIGAITAIAGNGAFGRNQVTVIATSQPFDRLAKAFLAAGYEREGDLLRAGPGARTPTSALVVASGPGLVVLAYSPAVARAALAGVNGITGTLRDLATWVNAPVVTIAGRSVPGANGAPPCVDAVAFADDVIDRRERIVFLTDSPNADRIARDGQLANVEPIIEDRHLTIPLTYDDEHSAANLVTTSTGMPDAVGTYRCA